MNAVTKHFLPVILVVFVTACQKIVYIDAPFKNQNLTLNSFFALDSIWTAKLSLNKSILDNAPNFTQVDNALIVIYQNDIALDTLINQGNGSYRSNSARATNTEPYTIVAQAEGYGKIEAVSYIPKLTPIQNVIVTKEPDYRNDDYDVQMMLKFNDDIAEKNFYQLKVYFGTKQVRHVGDTILVRYNGSMKSDDPIFDTHNSYTDALMLNDNLINGKNASLQIKARAYEGYSKIFVHLLSISEDYYKFQTTYNVQQNIKDDPFAQPIKVYNNINGGFGIFAGYSESVYVYSK